MTNSSSAVVTKKAPLTDSFLLLGRFLRDPRNIATIWPSSRVLADAMLRGLEARAGDLVVEFGPGTGAFTRVIIDRLLCVAETRYLGIEGDARLHALLRERFAALQFVCGRVEADSSWPEDLGAPRFIISGLPLISMPADVLRAIVFDASRRLAPGGIFRTFSYVHSTPTPGQRRLRRTMAEAFDEFHVSRPIARNLPPALVFTGTKRA
ncbi:MAG: hypothetical protein KDC95_13125 [Planctomycetes bacterium]|nr:hypothetical protein [Planctomycetota bacterium]